MLFKLSLKNLQKSIKDYAIYFLTLVLGVMIFYMFNSLDSQQSMLEISQSKKSMIDLLIGLLGMMSGFVAVVLGLLIVYANNFLINRRKKEFGIYMTLGMGKWQISRIILWETVFMGIISLAVGIVIGVFASQFMSVLTAKLFEVDMSGFTFVFSQEAFVKTCVYFAVMYLVVLLLNTYTISRYRLINLLHGDRKNEKIKMKSPVLSLFVFLVACGILACAYWKVTARFNTLSTAGKLLLPILMGIVGTILIFWSLSGFILQVVQRFQKLYLKDTNMFVLRQLNNKINTNVVCISVICLMLFMTITILSSSLALRNSFNKELSETAPVDIYLEKTANLPESDDYTEEQIADSKLSIQDTLINHGFDMDLLKDIVEIPVYTSNDLTWETFFGDQIEEAKKRYSYLRYETAELVVKISDYNHLAELYGQPQYELEENEYIVLCTFDSMKELRNMALAQKHPLEIAGKTYEPRYAECKEGFVAMAGGHVNTGIILVPDSCPLTEDLKEQTILAANYNATTEEEKEKIEELFVSEDSSLVQSLVEKGIDLDGFTKIQIYESYTGLSTIIIFIAIYLGIVFLIASAAILALKQLTESSDNRQRYRILRRIGCEERMINKALFLQIGIFFVTPVLLAAIHSIFGIKFALLTLEGLAVGNLLPSILGTIIIMGVVYGAYFLATFFCSRNIIKEEE